MQLKFNDRVKIEIYLKEGKTIREISNLLKFSYHTILREITNRRIIKINDKLPNSHIYNIEDHICDILKKQPVVCNKCPKYIRNTCNYDYIVYEPKHSQEQYLKGKSKKTTSKKEMFLKIVEKCIKQGQPLSHIEVLLKKKYEDGVSRKTIYNWIEQGLIKYNKRKYKLKKIKKSDEITYQMISRKELLKGKEYEDFLRYMQENPNTAITEIDLVEGCKGPNCSGFLLTMIIPSKQFLFAFKIPTKEPQNIVKIFDWLESKIGHKNFKRLFGVLLTDQGSEFLKYESITKSRYDSYTTRCKIFYCEPKSPYQKPYIENIHTLVRRYIPKGRNINDYEQDDINFMVSNLNSLYKVKYGNKSPIEMFLETYSKSILDKLGIEEISPEDIVISNYNKNSK